MSSSRLKIQFEQLFQFFGGEDSETQIEDITEILSCTRRNARMVLNKLTEQGWIEWVPAAGRGKLSTLLFKQDRQAVTQALVFDYLAQGKFDKASQIVSQQQADFIQLNRQFFSWGGSQTCTQIERAPATSSVAINQGCKLSIPYTYSINQDTTVDAMPAVVRRLTRAGITQFDANGEVHGDMAHHWQQISARHWRFFLRPQLRFFSGEIIATAELISHLQQLSRLPLFAHIQKVVSLQQQVIDVHLDTADNYFVERLAVDCAAVDLNQQRQLSHGAYAFDSFQDGLLQLQLNQYYHGVPSLLQQLDFIQVSDEVMLEAVDEIGSSPVFRSLMQPLATVMGSSYLVVNRKSGILKNENCFDYLLGCLQPPAAISTISIGLGAVSPPLPSNTTE